MEQAMLQMVRLAVREELQPVRDDISEMKMGIGILKTDVAGLKTDVADLQSDMVELKEEVGTLHIKVDRIESKLNVTFEQVVRNSESLTEVKDRVRFVNRRLADLELDISAYRPQARA